MKINVVREDIVRVEADVVIVAVYEKTKKVSGLLGIFDEKNHELISEALKSGEIRGTKKEITIFHTTGTSEAKRIMVVGMGNRDEVTVDTIRECMQAALMRAKKIHAKKICTSVLGEDILGCDSEKSLRGMVDAALIGLYEYAGYKKKNEEDGDVFAINELVIVTSDMRKVHTYQKIVHESVIIATAVNYARDLVNTPSNIVTPSYLAKQAKELSEENKGLRVKIYDETDLKKMKMNTMLAVAKGSDEPCKMIVLEWMPGSGDTLALIGKGITFDSGGISIKQSKGMKDMCDDMAGAASVLAAMKAVAQLHVKKNVIAIIPATENMPSGHAQKPGDVILTPQGPTVEIISTDAEGRLVLADALYLAQTMDADRIIDFATLTGACITALGHLYTGVLGNNNQWTQTVINASLDAGEKFWQLPLDKEYKPLLKSSVADIANAVENGEAGTITGGIFLNEFVDKRIPWVHCDIAGTASITATQGIYAKGATGVGVKTVLELLLRR